VGQETQSTTYQGETILVGRYAIRVRGGQLVVTDVTGAKPQFQRPKVQPGTIAVGHSEESREATIHASRQ
jgi:hypothetical protein